MFADKRAQAGEIMTWVVATIIIIVILITFVFVAVELAKTRKVVTYTQGYDRTHDLIMEKSLFAHFLAQDENTKIFIFTQLQNQEAEDKFSADLDDKFEEINEVLGGT